MKTVLRIWRAPLTGRTYVEASACGDHVLPSLPVNRQLTLVHHSTLAGFAGERIQVHLHETPLDCTEALVEIIADVRATHGADAVLRVQLDAAQATLVEVDPERM